MRAQERQRQGRREEGREGVEGGTRVSKIQYTHGERLMMMMLMMMMLMLMMMLMMMMMMMMWCVCVCVCCVYIETKANA